MENQIIDVALGLALAFMIVSVLVSAVQEFLAGFLDTRSKQLEKGIKCLLFGDTDPWYCFPSASYVADKRDG